MKLFGKTKASSKSNAKGTVAEGSDVVALMTRIMERLEALEKKTDLLIRQTSPGSIAVQKLPSHAGVRPEETKQDQHPSGRVRSRRAKTMFQAVCADCHKDCEIPFKPTGERPVYCNDCFSKRKSNRPDKMNHEDTKQVPPIAAAPGASDDVRREVSVTKKGVGKVTISEILRSPMRSDSSKKKPAAKQKK